MLIVNRKLGERIVIGGGIEITVTEISARKVRLGIVAPRGVSVLRGEVHDEVAAANASALDSESAAQSDSKEEARE
jgi:carbon storage regulator